MSAFAFSRVLATLVMSTLWIVVTCGEVRLESSMCSPILIRMALIGSMRVFAAPPAGGGCAPGARAGREVVGRAHRRAEAVGPVSRQADPRARRALRLRRRLRRCGPPRC